MWKIFSVMICENGYERQMFLFYHEDFTIVALKNVFIRDDLPVRRKRNNAIIDFAGLVRKVFQCTVSFDHEIKPRALEELLVVAGYIEKMRMEISLR
jgi:hypothetical protein